VSYASLGLKQGGRGHDLGPGMLKPFSHEDFALPATLKAAGGILEYSWMSDYGVATDDKVKLP
jgi:chaperone protein EcpD